MLPTYVFGWPTGQEKGSYLAVDLGGTNLRVCLVELEGDSKFEVTQTKYRLCVIDPPPPLPFVLAERLADARLAPPAAPRSRS